MKTLDYIPTGKLERAGKLVSTGVKIGGNYIKYMGDKITNPEQAKENLTAFIKRDVLFRESKDCYYIYQLIMHGRAQTGLVCVSSVDDYENDIIKKHEFTRPEKELDRINHIKTSGAQTGNVFLAYRKIGRASCRERVLRLV